MFVLSIQAKKKWGIVAVAAGVLLLALIVIPKLQPELSGGIPGETNSQRVTFLAQYGWEVEEEPVEIRDVTIPEEFDQVYEQYNEVQKSQGMDLAPYAGKTCRQWIYRVNNYPEEGTVQATILVYEGQIVGGDISSTELDGFLCGFAGQTGNQGGGSSEAPSSSALEASDAGGSQGGTQASSENGEQSASDAAEGSSSSGESSGISAESAGTDVIPDDAWPTD